MEQIRSILFSQVENITDVKQMEMYNFENRLIHMRPNSTYEAETAQNYALHNLAGELTMTEENALQIHV